MNNPNTTMSNKLNAEELAAKRYPHPSAILLSGTKVNHWATAYAAAIREVAQPLADERDELREAAEILLQWDDDSFRDVGYTPDSHRTEHVCIACGTSYEHDEDCPIPTFRAILAKYKK